MNVRVLRHHNHAEVTLQDHSATATLLQCKIIRIVLMSVCLFSWLVLSVFYVMLLYIYIFFFLGRGLDFILKQNSLH